MTHHNNISQHIFRMAAFRQTFFRTVFLRMALCLALLLCLTFNASAQTVWNGTEVSASLTTKDGTTANAGTSANPYLITSGADLKKLQSDNSLWDKHFLQTVDIDLGENVLGMIGDGATNGKVKGTPFAGVYDGGGNTIKNLKVDWSEVNSEEKMAFGLFGYLKGATVKNLQLDNAHVTRSAGATSNAKINGLKVGVLAGLVSPGTVIKNIAIHNSKLDDGGVSTTLQVAFFGGISGDITVAFETFNSINKAAGEVTIHDVYVNVDIDLGNCTRTDAMQFNVGGVIGRLRRGKYVDLPINAIYEGEIKAPWATVAPVIGASRVGTSGKAGDANNGDLYNLFAGEVLTEADENQASNSSITDALQLAEQITYRGFAINPHNNRYFGSYKVWDSTTNQFVTFTADEPGFNTRTRPTRTLGSVGQNEAFSNTTLAGMRAYQGVNIGKYANLSFMADRQKVLSMLNEETDDNVKFIWNETSQRVELQNKIDVALLERTTMHTFKAYTMNLDPGKIYTYKWRISDVDGNKWAATIESKNGTQQDSVSTDKVLKILGADNLSSSVAIVGEYHPYNRVDFEVYDGAEMVAAQSYDMGDVNIAILRDVYVKRDTTTVDGEEVIHEEKDHFLFRADIELEGHHIADEPEFFEGVTCQWFVKVGDDYVDLKSNTTYNATPAGESSQLEAHIKSTYVGNLRLKVFSQNNHEDPPSIVTMTHSVVDGQAVDFIEQVNTGLHLSLTMEEYSGTVNDTIHTIPFDPAHYHVKPELKGAGFYDNVYKDHTDSLGLITDITAGTRVKPLIFKVKVVDQFGNDWTSNDNALDHYRIQWNYRIPGEGYNSQLSANCDNDEPFDDEGKYCRVNGRFDPTDTNNNHYGLDANMSTSGEGITDYVRRKGHFQVINDSILIIHPNILHRTSAFWVRARLFDINHDAAGNHPVEEILSFNQLAVHIEKNATDNTLDGRVIWRQWNTDSVYVSQTSACDLIWYKSSDPTDPTKWVKVDSIHGTSRATTLDPSLYNPSLYYKLHYKSGFDLEAEDIIGPKNVVYVYDRAQTMAHLELTTFNPYDQTKNQYYPTGLITNHGHDPHHAVATMEQAYKLLDENGGVDDNVVVVMGYMEDTNFLSSGKAASFKRRATIAGANGNISGSTIWMAGTDNTARNLASATKFKDITWYGSTFDKDKGYTPSQFHFYCNLHDLTIDTGVKMMGYQEQEANANGLGNYTATHITIVGGNHNYNKTDILAYPKTNADTTRTTMTFRSGTFARIISGARNSGKSVNDVTKNIYGTPKNPHRVKVVVDIQEERTEDERRDCPYDIGLLVGGQTDGTLFTEAEIEMKGGSVGRYISGNISFGRFAGENHPSDSFYGSTTLDMYGGQIKELVGGTLGRYEATRNQDQAEKCDAFFYGRSIINIHGGKIDSKIYGAGAGGVTGLGDATNHTDDILIPYYDSNDELRFGDYTTATATGNTIPSMNLSKEDDKLELEGGKRNVLDFAKSYVEVNVKGGTINGNIYGGGYGYSDNITAERAIRQAGYLFGNCYVNISGGTVNGNIYGGGAGSKDYFNKYAQAVYESFLKETYDAAYAAWLVEHKNDTEGAKTAGNNAKSAAETKAQQLKAQAEIDKDKFKRVACVYGNTSVNVSGGIITGSVYGGGQGILGFADMAKVIGDTYVTISGGDLVGSVEQKNGGNVYGGASLGEIRGNTNVKLIGGYIGANVFGGSEGDAAHPEMATVYGKTNVMIGEKTSDGKYSGTAIVNASIYGGCNVSSIRKPAGAAADYGTGMVITKNSNVEEFKSMTKVIVNSGDIGNNIYGGSRGNDTVPGAVTDIEGDTYVRINGGNYINYYYITDKNGNPVTDSNGNKRYRDFNIFGGGEKKCTIAGTAHLDVRSGLMSMTTMAALPYYEDDAVQEEMENAVVDIDINIFIPHDENPNALVTDKTSKFQGPYMDLTYRRFSLYGGGYGEQTNCLNTDVFVYIPTDKRKPHGRTLKVPYDHQSFFDIAGGGYSGDIGYWANANGERVAANAPASDYDHYVGGECNVTIDGFTYARKVIGGGFYGSCKTTNTKILCGSLRQAYGGSLLGYVHDRALLEIGNKPENLTNYNDPAVAGMSNEAKAKWLNDYIFFTENVYGGNDVKGIVGTKQWSWSDGAGTYYGQEGTDGGPLWQADVDKEEDKGVVMNIFGGTFMGDVFGAGNGHYRGYYVPGWIRYDDGPERMYRMVRGIDGLTYDEDVTANPTEDKASIMARHRVYRTRPMVGSVNINITGNNADDMVKFQGNFYGGGRECSIGQWNTILPMEDPRRLSTGGHLHINVGGNVDFEKNLYMGVYGGLYGEQQYMPDSVSIENFIGSTTTELEKIGELAYDHWYFNKDATTANNGRGRYEPGFPAPGKADGNFGLLGEHMFRGYFKNIEMEGDVELTFYKELYAKKADGTDSIAANGQKVRKRWLPAELAVDAYDAENITMNSFFLGGKCGYMTNNTYNVYCYTDSVGKHLRDVEKETDTNHKHEQWGSVYRIVMPEGVTIKDKLVMGVEDAVTKYYKYNDTFTAPDSTTTVEGKKVPDLIYTFEGGLVTQTTYSFDHVAYNDMMTKECEDWNNESGRLEADKKYHNPTIYLPDDFYLDKSANSYNNIKNLDEYTLQAGIYAGKKIYRRYYDTYGLKNYMLRPNGSGGYTNENNQERRYGLAVVYNDNATHTNGNESGAEPFFGRRASRTAAGDHQTVTKLTARCMFNPQKGTKPVTVDPSLSDELKEKGYHKLYGGIIYGGCYNSGVVIGDVILNVASNMLGKNVTPENQSDWFDHISGLGHYIGRVYGGGYGVDTRNEGDTYINLLRDVQAMNVFGGGMQGTVTGDTYINYTGTDKSYIYGAIYGGGFQGAVGKYYWRNNDYKEDGKTTTLLSQAEYDRLEDADKGLYHLYVETNGTNLTLISGNVDHVYGGSCMSNMYGATNIEMYDEVAGSLPHLDFAQYGNEFTANWPDARLIVGTVYGGNDISGEIIHTDDKYQTRTDIYDTHVTLEEIQEIDKNGNFGKTATPGAKYGYNGFPLVGNLYGGSNGNYGQQEKPEGKNYYVYKAGSMIKFASGKENEIISINIGAKNDVFDSPLQIPNVDRANIEILGGTVVNLYGGGDMSTITGKTNIKVAYAVDTIKTDNGEPTTKYGNIEARAGFHSEDELQRVWNTCHVTSRQQMAEVMDYSTRAFLYNIYRIFGGNNHADMAIQPSWELTSGHVGSVYSGANFGKMTYYNPDADPNSTDEYKKYKGLALTINSRNFHANAVYGGGRVGDVHPAVPAGTTATDDLYGTTLTIKDGVIDHVYGGNDVSGEVHYGSKVDIQGAISGDVYCAGNGNYVYQYGYPEGYKGDTNIIGEDYIITDETTKSGYRYFILPAKAEFSATDDIEKVKAINSYRPNVTRSNLTIGSTNADKPAYVHGSIYMGGNSATVLPSEESNNFITFNIGSNVIINSIFMGSNGEHLVDDDMIKHTNERNNFNIGSSDAILNKYFEAVDVEGLPKNFALADTITNVNIGSFFLGGNRGSMTTSKTIELEFPENITIYGKIVGGSNNANYEYGTTAKHVGGLKTPLADGITDKVHLIVKSKFLPKYLKYPDEDWRKATFEDNIRDDQGNVLYRQYVTVEGKLKAVAYQTREYDETNKTYTYSDEYTGKTYLPQGTCNIYGGCYNSGVTVGNIKIDLYSDMLLFGPEWKGVAETGKTKEETLLALRTREQTVINCVDGLNDKSWHPFSVIGGGYGSGTSVYGDINVRLLPTITGTGTDRKASHPSCGNVFGGAQEGVVVGNTTVELRDGTVLANVYGASESSYMYGSTQILIGYPEYYECNESGQYTLQRADIYSKAITDDDWKTNANDNSEVVKHSVWYRAGDIVPKNVYEQIIAANAANASKFNPHTKEANNEDTPGKFVTDATWDDINISVGDPSSRNARTAADIDSIPYFGYGNVYGGGFVPTAANSAFIGQKTLLRFKDTYKPIGATESNITNYGGNSAIMIWDNPENAEMNTGGTYKYTIGSPATGGTGAVIKDHVSIGTGQFVPVRLNNGDNKMGLYYYKPESGTNPSEFVHQPSGNYSDEKDEGKTFYEIVGDGGIFGGGRKVYCEGFRACDLAYYGYADYAPQMAKLINSFQRIDLLSLTDCCLQLQASQDFASTTSDAGEQYSITRVGELRMNSSLAESNINLNAGVVDTLNIGNTNHNVKRSRNFLGFYRSVKFLGALVSNVDFSNAQYHDSLGVYKADTTYLVKKDSIIGKYYSSSNGTDDYEKFKKRNVGTSANMIGINNGYSLRIQGTRQVKDGEKDVDEAYYGPAIGVTEIKLLTMAIGEGGGYVYALNKHEEKEPTTPSGAPTRATSSGLVTPSFLQTLGNFVFPGANFGLKEVNGVATPTLNYIIDDCFPIGHGYDKYISEGKTNVNDAQEIHYWYVNGQRYFYNATLTAYTGTPDGQPDIFKLDNSDNLIMLAGIDSTTQYLRVKSIKWDVPNADYDLTRDANSEEAGVQLLEGYNLYVTVGDKPQTLITPSDADKKNAWTAELTRTDYKLIDTTSDTNGNEVFNPNYTRDDVNLASDRTDQKTNGTYSATMPLLGLSLTDNVANNDKTYYTTHLSQPSKMQVVLASTNDGLDYEYTLNLTIVYLKGTDISGHIVIENCALPGERIYANAFDVKVEGDDPNITNRKWVLYKVNTTFDDNGDVVSTTPMEDVDISDNFLVEENSPERIAIPAYYWMNGWHLAYQMNVNGKTERVYVSTSTDTEHKVINVHNYHRMMAWDRNHKTADNEPDIQDLQLTAGARVYIEDADDLDYFLTYMKSVQADNCSSKGRIGTTELPADYDSHVIVNPQYAEGIHFILLNDVKMKENAAQSFKFNGRLSGLGHTIDLNNCTQFMGENLKNGSIYFTGFLSKGETKVVGTNNGRFFGCFNYNTEHTGKLIGTVGDDDNLQYSFQNSYPNDKDHYNYTTYYDDLDFANGKAAYDLNAFYLNERYKKATGQPGNENDRFKSYVYNYYGDGEYRYANWDKAYRQGTATALRTAAHPNYYTLARITAEEMDALTGVGAEVSAGIGAAAFSRAKTYHNCEHTADNSRTYVKGHYVDVTVDGVKQSEWIPDYYEPNYPQDFMFWGQDIKSDGDKYPVAIKADGANRVFRASGFYGTQEDLGFYFNRAEAVMQHPRLTAVDFTGQRMRDGAGEYKLNKQVFPTSGTPKQTIIFPPVLDLPTNGKLFEGTTYATAMQLGGISVVGNVSIDSVNKVTKNLLVYIPSDKVTEVQFPQNNDESEIIAHRIDWNSTTEKYSTEQFHLVDKQDFNAPIAFHADSIWYERVPEKFSSGDNAWESLSLPFTAKNVRARATSAVTTNDNSHGLLTHFFGKDKEDVYGDGTPRSHEYWLRKFTGMETDKNIAKFHRPRSEQDSINNGVSKKVNMSNTASGSGSRNNNEGEELINFHYSNTYYSKAYGTDGYIQDPSHIRPQYTTEGVYYKDYPLITAGFPYIVTYPGVRYYEFDLSGEFYKKYNPMSDATPQIISYENSNYDVPVTDSIRKVFEHDNYKFVSAFMHEDSTAYRANPVTEIEKDNNDAEKMDANGVYKIMSTTFESNTPIIPFRAYLSSETVLNNIAINTRTISLDEDSDEQEEKYTGVNLYVRGTDLIVTSDHDFILPLYGISGQLYRNLPVRAGMNVYHNLNTGVYVALGHKFVVRSR